MYLVLQTLKHLLLLKLLQLYQRKAKQDHTKSKIDPVLLQTIVTIQYECLTVHVIAIQTVAVHQRAIINSWSSFSSCFIAVHHLCQTTCLPWLIMATQMATVYQPVLVVIDKNVACSEAPPPLPPSLPWQQSVSAWPHVPSSLWPLSVTWAGQCPARQLYFWWNDTLRMWAMVVCTQVKAYIFSCGTLDFCAIGSILIFKQMWTNTNPNL